MFIETTALNKLLELTKRIRGVAGGTSASKTVGIIQILTDKCQSDKTPKKRSIVSETFPHLSKGAEEDFKNIMKDHGYWKDARWHGSNHIYTFETNSRLEFFSADQPGKVRGPRRDELFINEANNISFETFEQLEVRTREIIWLDWNPVSEFWFYTDVLNSEEFADVVDFLTLTYKDNEGLEQSVIDSIERRRGRKNWWKVFGLGQLGEIEGKIYNDWKIINEIPHEARFVGFGLNFGYSNHATALVDVYYYNGGYILDERLFGLFLKNPAIAEAILNKESDELTVADSAEPKSIDEIKDEGVNIVGAKKAGDGTEKSYLKWSIGIVQGVKISVTSRSLNIISEYRNYLWEIDRDGHKLNVPEQGFHFSMDAIRYKIISLVKPKKRGISASNRNPEREGYAAQRNRVNRRVIGATSRQRFT